MTLILWSICTRFVQIVRIAHLSTHLSIMRRGDYFVLSPRGVAPSATDIALAHVSTLKFGIWRVLILECIAEINCFKCMIYHGQYLIDLFLIPSRLTAEHITGC